MELGEGLIRLSLAAMRNMMDFLRVKMTGKSGEESGEESGKNRPGDRLQQISNARRPSDKRVCPGR
jgi:hypothetical protein